MRSFKLALGFVLATSVAAVAQTFSSPTFSNAYVNSTTPASSSDPKVSVGLNVKNNTELAALKSTTVPSGASVIRLGYAAAGDSPPISYAAYSGACTLNSGAGDGGAQVPSSDGKCWVATFPDSGIDLRWYGASTSSANNAPAINAALSYVASTGGKLQFPCGTFTVTSALTQSLTARKHLEIAGSGLDCTIIRQASSATLFRITYGSVDSSVSIHDMTLTTTGTGSGNGIELTGTGDSTASPNSNNSFYNLLIRGDDYATTNLKYFAYGVYQNNVTQVSYVNITVFGSGSSAGTGITINGNSSTEYSLVANIANSFFGATYAGVYLQSYWQGVSIVNTNFGGSYGVFQAASASGVPAQILISNSQFNCSAAGISLSSTVLGSQFTNNLFLLENNSAYGIAVNAPQTSFVAIGNVFNGTGALGYGIATGAAITNGHIAHNAFNAINVGISTSSGTYSLSLDKNISTGAATTYNLNASGSGIIIDDTSSPRTVATLPTPNAAWNGAQSIAIDASAPTYGGTLTGGGTSIVRVIVSGGVWRSQ
jgi:hypothetical protein